MKKYFYLLTTILIASLMLTPSQAAPTVPKGTFAEVTGKKLIEYGWDNFYSSDPKFIRDHIREMEEQPFEGIAFTLPSQQSRVFRVKGWKEDPAVRSEQIKILSSIEWDKFTDNFLTILATSDQDWYSDSDWEKVLSKTQYIGQAAQAAKCKGIVFDPEPYGNSVWKYSAQARIDQYSFEEYSAKAFQRGQQFIQAMQTEMPNLKLLMFYQYSAVLWEANNLDPAKRSTQLKASLYGLMIPFLNGMLSAASKDVQFIDGNEGAYFYKNPDSFYQAYWEMRQHAAINVPDDLKKKFNDHIRAGSSLYVDQIYALRPKSDWRGPVLAYEMTQEQRSKWFEQNVYYALKTSDEYVWLYGERMDWFNHPTSPNDKTQDKEWKGVAPPEGITEAILSAKKKLMEGKKLGYSMEPILAEAKAKADAKADAAK